MTKLLILGIATVGAVTATVLDHENLLGTNNPEHRWWWQRPPFVKPPTQGLSIAQQAQVRRMLQAQKPKEQAVGTYHVTAPSDDRVPRPVKGVGPYEGYYKQ